MQLSQGEICKEEGGSKKYFQTTINFYCNYTMEKGKYKFSGRKYIPAKDKCNLTLSINSTHACPMVNYYSIASFLDGFKIAMSILLMIVGVYLLVFGPMFPKPTVFVVVNLTTIALTVVIFFNIFTFPEYWVIWVVAGCAAVLGIFLTFLSFKVKSTFLMIQGVSLGYSFGSLIYELFLVYIHSNPQVVYWLTIAVAAAIGAGIGYCLPKHVFIIGSGFAGGYLVIKGISLLAGGFPDQSIVIDLVKHNEDDQLYKVYKI
jgi:hypothetical protein